jgi:hypothetical protein
MVSVYCINVFVLDGKMIVVVDMEEVVEVVDMVVGNITGMDNLLVAKVEVILKEKEVMVETEVVEDMGEVVDILLVEEDIVV